MTRALPEDDGALAAAGVEQVLEAAGRGGALALGPGLGRSDGRGRVRAPRWRAQAAARRWCSTPTA